jgi:hypothetical protein
VWFTDRHDSPLDIDRIGMPIQRSVSTIDTVTREIVVPPTAWDLVLHIGLGVGAETFTPGDLQVTYLVKRAK